jgi:hypothetical protein
MAIKKRVTADNGIVTEYHRVVLVRIDVNQHNTILVHSYLNEDGRQIEKDYAAGLYKDVEAGFMKFPYVDAKYLHPAYDENMTVKGAYEYLKTLPQFEGAEDV